MAGVSARRLMFEALIVAAAIGGALLLRDRGVAAVSRGDGWLGRGPADRGRAGAGRDRGRDPRRAPVSDPAAPRSPGSAARGRGLVPMLAARRATRGRARHRRSCSCCSRPRPSARSPPRPLDHLDRGAERRRLAGGRRLVPDRAPNGALPVDAGPDHPARGRGRPSVFQGLVPVGLAGPQSIVRHRRARRTSRRCSQGPRSSPRSRPGSRHRGRADPGDRVALARGQPARAWSRASTFTMSIEGYNLTYLVAEVRDSFPGVPLDRHFVVIAREAFLGQAPPARIVPVYALLRAPDDGRARRSARPSARRRRRSRCPARRSAPTSSGRRR